MFIFLRICSSIPTLLFRYFFHLETASLKTIRLYSVLISLGQLLSFNFNFNLKAGVKISTH